MCYGPAAQDVLTRVMPEPTRADESLALRTTLLCGLVVVLEGYDLSALGYVVPQLVEAWHVQPVAFTPALTASNIGMMVVAVDAAYTVRCAADQCHVHAGARPRARVAAGADRPAVSA